MADKIRIALIGLGRLGKCIASLILQNPSFQLTAAIVRPSSPLLGQDVSALLNLPPANVLLTASCHCSCDVYIDASLPAALQSNLDAALAAKKPIVIAATGLSSSDIVSIQRASLAIPIFHAPNFSLGMALLRKFAEQASALFHTDADIDLIETHHTQKKDSPSGSALLLAKTIGKPVNIHSIRSGKVVGEHTLIFNTPDERICLTHEAHSRDAFARGALAAARFLSSKPPGIYTMEDLIQLIEGTALEPSLRGC
jgi:4-hydroxy-tetrahydrodipicolinate reductase